MRQLTLRGFDERLEARIVELARSRSISLNRAALLLLRRGAGLEEGSAPLAATSTVGSGLDKFIGVWSADEEEEFLRSIQSFDRVDSGLWE